MKKLKLIVSVLLTVAALSCTNNEENNIQSPDGNISASVNINDAGAISYNVLFNNEIIVDKSQMGILMSDEDFSSKLKHVGTDPVETVTDQYEMIQGKRKNISYQANKTVFHFENENGKKMDIAFQVSNDGVAFRYVFPETSEDVKVIEKEITSYNFNEGTKAWIQPMAVAKTGWERTNPSYEEEYVQETEIADLPKVDAGWIYPALFNTNNAWVCITETAPYRDYCGTRLLSDSGSYALTVGFPSNVETLNETSGANPNHTLPWETPWRVLAIGNTPGVIVESTLGTDLAKSKTDMDFSFVKTGRASWSWVMLKDDSIVYPVQKRFVDYSADMGWEYCLIDVNWDSKIGYEKIKELADYGAEKGVGLILWYNSAGSWNTAPYEPRDKMLTQESRDAEFSKLKEMGIKGVKVDFFGGDGQDVMSYYLDIIETAAKYGIVVNTHGCTLPRGWHRTYPNLVTMESVKGEEFCTFEQRVADNQPTHSCMLPFTRNAFDPMDFTPVVFGEIPFRERATTNSFELALSVVFLSGVQHYAQTDIQMKTTQPVLKQYLKEIPNTWDATKFVQGYPGKLAVIARRTGNTWYVAGINGEKVEKDLTLDLSFIKPCDGELISDVTSREVQSSVVSLSQTKTVPVKVLPNGGFVMKFVEI